MRPGPRKQTALPATPRADQRGITLVESALSILLVGGVLIAALNTLGGSRKAHQHHRAQAIGDRLCEDLLNEIRSTTTGQPLTINGSSPATGQAVGSLGTAATPHRIAFTTPMQYDGWQQSPPVDRWGIQIPSAAGFTRSVAVRQLDPSDLSSTSNTDEGLYEVKLTVQNDRRTVASVTAILSGHAGGITNPEAMK